MRLAKFSLWLKAVTTARLSLLAWVGGRCVCTHNYTVVCTLGQRFETAAVAVKAGLTQCTLLSDKCFSAQVAQCWVLPDLLQ